MTTDVGICSLELCKKRPKINLFAIAQVQNDQDHASPAGQDVEGN